MTPLQHVTIFLPVQGKLHNYVSKLLSFSEYCSKIHSISVSYMALLVVLLIWLKILLYTLKPTISCMSICSESWLSFSLSLRKKGNFEIQLVLCDKFLEIMLCKKEHYWLFLFYEEKKKPHPQKNNFSSSFDLINIYNGSRSGNP